MKLNTLHHYIILLLVSCSYWSVQASDNLSIEQVDEILDKYVRGGAHFQPLATMADANLSSTPSLLPDVVSSTHPAPSTAPDPSSPAESALKYVISCREAHVKKTDFPPIEAEADFYQNDSFLRAHISLDNNNATDLNYQLFYYHTEAARFFLSLDNYSEALKNLLKASDIDALKLTNAMTSFMANKFRMLTEVNIPDTDKPRYVSHESKGALLKCAEVYQAVRAHQKEYPLDTIDYITLCVLTTHGHDYRSGINYGLKALAGTLPAESNPLYRFKSSPHSISRYLAVAYFELKEFEKVEKIYQSLPSDEMDVEDYIHLSVICSLQKNWAASYNHFVTFSRKAKERSGHNKSILYTMDEDVALPLIEMLMHISESQFNTHGRPFVKLLKDQIPPLQGHLEKLTEFLRAKKKEEARKLVLASFAQSIIENTEKLYKAFDDEYTKVWAHSSLLPPDQQGTLLKTLNAIAKKIEDDHQKFMEILQNGSHAEKVVSIRQLYSSMQESLAAYKLETKEINDEIAKARRQHYRQAQQTPVDRSSYVEFNYQSTHRVARSEILAQQAKRELEIKEKEEAAEAKRHERQMSREPLAQAYKAKAPDLMPTASIKSEDNSSKPSHICTFKDGRLKTIWKDPKSTHENKDVLEMLEAINASVSMYDLRQRLTPGAALEILKGDREGQISLRINSQYRLCFYWVTGHGAFDLEMVDYH
jgi:proteic killer suppression protein